MRITLDTNLLVYAEGVGDKARCLMAREVIAGLPVENVLIPVQVLGELHRVLTRKAGRTSGESKEAILDWTDALATIDTTGPGKRFGSGGRSWVSDLGCVNPGGLGRTPLPVAAE